MRTLMIIALCLILTLAADAASKPNILLILTDDGGYADFSCYNGKGIQTPNIDRIATGGVRFTQGYVSAAVCSPSRAGLLTGRYQQKFGHPLNIPRPGLIPSNDNQVMGLPVTELTLADLLKQEGYRTAVLGKWHLGEEPQFQPNQRGFDYFSGILAGHRNYFLDQPAKYDGERWMRNGAFVEESGYMTELLTEEALEFIGQESDQPFFLYLSHFAPHAPMIAKPEDLSAFEEIKWEKRRKYAAMMLNLDRGIGRVLDHLETSGLDTNTLVIFLNDNGGPTDANASQNWPLRGTKGTEFEGGIRVAYMMQHKGVLPAGVTYDEPVISLDVLPTAVAAVGGDLPDDREYDGVNLLPYLLGEREGAPHEELFWMRFANAAVRRGDWKLLATPKKTMLFNLKDDIREKHDLSAEHPELVAELEERLAAWKATHPPRLWDTEWTLNK